MKSKNLLVSIKLLSLVFVVMVNCAPETPRADGQISRPVLLQDNISQHDESLQCGLWRQSAWPRIPGGKDANPGEFPWHVALHLKDDSARPYRCGGVIIDRSYVLTAAHCFGKGGKIYELTVRVGSLNRNATQSDTQIDVEKHWTHELYEANDTIVHDIAILKTASEMDFKLTEGGHGSVNSICLPSAGPQLGETLTVSGWGCTDPVMHLGCKLSEKLLKTDLEVRDSLDCPREYETDDICAGSNTNSGINYGDSGSPLVRYAPEKRTELAGIVSCGYEDALRPSIYANVYSHLAWIAGKMKEGSGASY